MPNSESVPPGSFLSASCVCAPLVLRTVLGDKHHYQFHFTQDKIEAHSYGMVEPGLKFRQLEPDQWFSVGVRGGQGVGPQEIPAMSVGNFNCHR